MKCVDRGTVVESSISGALNITLRVVNRFLFALRIIFRTLSGTWPCDAEKPKATRVQTFSVSDCTKSYLR
jgi:hypothetical protein